MQSPNRMCLQGARGPKLAQSAQIRRQEFAQVSLTFESTSNLLRKSIVIIIYILGMMKGGNGQ